MHGRNGPGRCRGRHVSTSTPVWLAEFSSRVHGALPQPALRCFWSVHRALILAVSYILKQSMCSFSGPAPLRPASKQWPPCGALPRALPSLRIPSYAVIVSCLPVQANPRITTSSRRPTGGRAVHRARCAVCEPNTQSGPGVRAARQSRRVCRTAGHVRGGFVGATRDLRRRPRSRCAGPAAVAAISTSWRLHAQVKGSGKPYGVPRW